jgi:hypothetical protein
MRESFQTNVVVKLVRSQFLIPGMKDQFSPTLLNVRRDPRAVIASLLSMTGPGG